MSVMAPENERLVLDGMVFVRMQSAILLFVFQRRAEELLVRGEVVPNGEDVTVERPEAGAAEPDFFPASDEVAMSKMPLPPDFAVAEVLPEPDDAEFDSRPPRELPACATRAQLAARQKKAVSAMRILIGLFLSVRKCCPCKGLCS